MLIKVLKIEYVEAYKLFLRFSDGSEGVYDCAEWIAEGGPMVEPLKDKTYFARVFLELGAPTWPNGYDIAPWAAKAEMKAAGTLKKCSEDVA